MSQTAEEARRRFNKFFFTEVVSLACWNIWKIRNAKIFENVQPRFATWRSNFIHDISLHAHRFKSDKKQILMEWVNTLH
jgi:hypothetical protein